METIVLSGAVARVLAVTMGVLFVVTAAFSLYAVALRLSYERRNRRWARLSERWSGPLLTALTEPAKAGDIHALIAENERLYFVHFVLDYHQRVRGDEQSTLETMVEPYLDVIVERARHRSPEVRMRAVQTLGALGLPRYRSVVEDALGDRSETVAVVAIRALADPAFIDGAPRVLEALPRLEAWAPALLGSVVADLGPGASPELRERLADPACPTWLRSVYAIALRLQRDPRAADVAARVLTDLDVHGDLDDVDFASELLRLLASVGRPEHASAATRWLNAPIAALRAQAARALGSFGGEEVARSLVESLDDDSPWVVSNAARGLLAAGGRRFALEVAERYEAYAAAIGQALAEADA